MTAFNRLHLIRQIDLFTLRLFLSAIEERQIGLAAIRENIAASTATKRIQVLENIAGVELLVRTPKGVVPSAAGTILARHARRIFDSLDDMRSEFASLTEGVRGELRVVSARSVIVPFLAHELGEFSREFPLVDLIVHEVENSDIVKEIARGEADLGVFASAYGLDLDGVDVTPYRRDRLVVVTPRGHHLAERGAVTILDLLPENLIAPQALVAALRASAQRAGEEYKPTHVLRSGGTAISLVHAGLGVTVQPECLVGHEWSGRVAVLDLDEPWAERRIHLATPRGRELGPSTELLVEHLLATSAAETTDALGLPTDS
ncbi:LysR family transcriptional regulator [Nocardia sp. NPDC051929]|uniref:LysR family transcriptional regulator n=1 Tax=Nocardia sp. NPDC051929 TaxID=3364327 RepID=UPI0037CA5A9A